MEPFKTFRGIAAPLDRANVDTDQIIAKQFLKSIKRTGFGESLFNANALRSMKKGAYFINTARGELVDEEALFQCLESKHLAGAALDVYKKEPYSGKLTQLENIILTPHIASFTQESRSAMEMESVLNLLKGLNAS